MRTVSANSRGIALAAALVWAALALLSPPTQAGDSLYGKITAVKRADLLTLDHGAGTYDIRLAGIELPKDRGLEAEAKSFMSKMVLDKPARLRFRGRTAEGEMVGRIFTDDPKAGIKDVGEEMVRAGLAVPKRGYHGYKYAQLAKAAREARNSKRGVWSEQ